MILPTFRYGFKVVKSVFVFTFVDDSRIIDVEATAVECIPSVVDLTSGEADVMAITEDVGVTEDKGVAAAKEFAVKDGLAFTEEVDVLENVANKEDFFFIKDVTVKEDEGVVKT